MAKKMKGFSSATFKHLKQELKNDIINAPEQMPEFKKEIARVFQVANRRIQNIEKKGEFSPAVVSLGKGDISSYTKFSMKATSWTELKKEYIKAVTFLRQPTSTASGTGQYTKHIKDAYDLSDDDYNLISDSLNKKLMSVSDSDYVERYLMRYKDFTGELQSEARSVSHQLETDAERLISELDDQIVDSAIEALSESERLNQQQIKNVIDTFDDLGLSGYW